MTPARRASNVLGALALIVNDLCEQEIVATTGLSSSAAAAVSALDEFLDRPTVDKMRQVLGLTPSGAVRLVDRLAEADLVSRAPGPDGRSRAVVLTERGVMVAGEITAARARVLDRLIEGFTDDQLGALHVAMGQIMNNAVIIKSGGAWICRLCDFDSCERHLGRCPAAIAASQYSGGGAAHQIARDRGQPG